MRAVEALPLGQIRTHYYDLNCKVGNGEWQMLPRHAEVLLGFNQVDLVAIDDELDSSARIYPAENRYGNALQVELFQKLSPILAMSRNDAHDPIVLRAGIMFGADPRASMTQNFGVAGDPTFSVDYLGHPDRDLVLPAFRKGEVVTSIGEPTLINQDGDGAHYGFTLGVPFDACFESVEHFLVGHRYFDPDQDPVFDGKGIFLAQVIQDRSRNWFGKVGLAIQDKADGLVRIAPSSGYRLSIGDREIPQRLDAFSRALTPVHEFVASLTSRSGPYRSLTEAMPVNMVNGFSDDFYSKFKENSNAFLRGSGRSNRSGLNWDQIVACQPESTRKNIHGVLEQIVRPAGK